MVKTTFYYLALFVCIALCFQFKPIEKKISTKAGLKKPNILFIITDQQSFDMLGCYGNKQIITPHIDTLAANGIRFNQCISNSPLCTPYRAMLLTGQHPIRTGGFSNDIQILSSEEAGSKNKYFGEILRDNGYKMGYIGKWHLYGGDRNRPIPSGPYRYGFDNLFLSNNCTLEFDAEHAYYWDEDGKKTLYHDWEPNGQALQASNFLETNGDQPFALFVSFHAPHNWGSCYCYGAPSDLVKLYDLDKIKLRKNCLDTYQNRVNYQGHMAMITSLDRAIGKIFDKLKEKKLDDNTIIVFTSDHGDMLMSHNWPENKGMPENESLHVPLLMKWSSVLPPGTTDLLMGTLDFMPTLLSMVHIPIPSSCQGKDLSDAIFKNKGDVVSYVPIFNHHLDWRGIYTKQFTYSFSTDKKNEAIFIQKVGESFSRNCLFDRINDPEENHNLYNLPAYKNIRDSLNGITLQWMRSIGDVDMLGKDIYNTIKLPEKDGKVWPSVEGKVKDKPSALLK